MWTLSPPWVCQFKPQLFFKGKSCIPAWQILHIFYSQMWKEKLDRCGNEAAYQRDPPTETWIGSPGPSHPSLGRVTSYKEEASRSSHRSVITNEYVTWLTHLILCSELQSGPSHLLFGRVMSYNVIIIITVRARSGGAHTIYKSIQKVWTLRALQNNVWLLNLFDDQKEFNPVCEGLALWNFCISDGFFSQRNEIIF